MGWMELINGNEVSEYKEFNMNDIIEVINDPIFIKTELEATRQWEEMWKRRYHHMIKDHLHLLLD